MTGPTIRDELADLIDCEGSGCPPASKPIDPSGICVCAMCGRAAVAVDGVVLYHQRDDVVARIERGDFA